MENYRSSGFVGISPGVSNETDSPLPFFPQMFESFKKNGHESVFSFYFSKSIFRDGVMTFGGYNTQKFGKPEK